MKVGIDARGAIWYRGTGIGTYTYQLLHHLKQGRERNNYRLFYPGEEYAGLDIAKREDFVPVEENPDYWESYFLPKMLEKEHISLYHVPQNGIGLPAKKVCPQVVTIHDLIPYIYPETVGKKYLQVFLQRMPWIMENTDAIITVSEHSKEDIIDVFHYPAEKIHVIYEAPEPVYQLLPKAESIAALREYGIDKKYILYVGGFGPRKNVRGLLVAFAKVCREIPGDYLLVCPGNWQREGNCSDELIAALGLTERVIFPGYVPVNHLPWFYSGAELFVYPSFYEGFGLPVLEAMACGTPVVASTTSSLPEVAGNAALLIDPHDTHHLAEAMYEVLTDKALAADLSAKGLTRSADFSWQKTAMETAQVYQDILSQE